MIKMRLDQLLVEGNYFESRQKAKGEIMAGNILVNQEKITKAGTLVNEDSEIQILNRKFPYVSRGALKLKKALEYFKLDVENLRCMDIGASTGGFTEILLINGAQIVYSIDVGYNQLAWSLRQDDRVIVMEKTNARHLDLDQVDGKPFDLIVTDVSFISLKKILEPAYKCLKENGQIIALIKPQFEAGREAVNKKGVVLNPEVHKQVIKDIQSFAASLGFSVNGLTFSPIKGPKGNREYLLYLIKGEPLLFLPEEAIDTLVEKSFKDL